MDTIKIYLDNVFAAFAQTRQLENLKHDMLAGMEEKYANLRQQGHSENEAVGIIIANFGSIDEIAAALGEKPTMRAHAQDGQSGIPQPLVNDSWASHIPCAPSDWVYTSYEQAKDYAAHHNKRSYMLGAGIWLIFVGISLYTSLGDLRGLLALVLSIALAVPMIVVSFVKMYYYAGFNNKNARINSETYAMLLQDQRRLMPRYAIRCIFALALIFMAIWGVATGQTNAHVVLISTVGCAMFLFIPAWVNKIVYDFFLGMSPFYFKNGKTAILSMKRLVIQFSIAAIYGGIAGGLFANLVQNSSVAPISWVVFPLQFIFTGITTDIVNWSFPDINAERGKGVLQ